MADFCLEVVGQVGQVPALLLPLGASLQKGGWKGLPLQIDKALLLFWSAMIPLPNSEPESASHIYFVLPSWDIYA